MNTITKPYRYLWDTCTVDVSTRRKGSLDEPVVRKKNLPCQEVIVDAHGNLCLVDMEDNITIYGSDYMWELKICEGGQRFVSPEYTEEDYIQAVKTSLSYAVVSDAIGDITEDDNCVSVDIGGKIFKITKDYIDQAFFEAQPDSHLVISGFFEDAIIGSDQYVYLSDNDLVADRARKLYAKSHNQTEEEFPMNTRYYDPVVVFLDIDGAISPYTRRFDKEEGVSVDVPLAYDFTYYLGGLNMPLASHTIHLLRSLSANQAVWSSSWGEMSNEFNEELDLPLFDYTMKKQPGYTKAKAMEYFLDNHPEIEKVILVEDEPYRFHHPEGVDVEIIQTDPYVGLTEEQVEAIFGTMGL